jgi:hypothetical protein
VIATGTALPTGADAGTTAFTWNTPRMSVGAGPEKVSGQSTPPIETFSGTPPVV